MLHNEELCDLYRSPGAVGVVKYRGLQWDAYVARMHMTCTFGTVLIIHMDTTQTDVCFTPICTYTFRLKIVTFLRELQTLKT